MYSLYQFQRPCPLTSDLVVAIPFGNFLGVPTLIYLAPPAAFSSLQFCGLKMAMWLKNRKNIGYKVQWKLQYNHAYKLSSSVLKLTCLYNLVWWCVMTHSQWAKRRCGWDISWNLSWQWRRWRSGTTADTRAGPSSWAPPRRDTQRLCSSRTDSSHSGSVFSSVAPE